MLDPQERQQLRIEVRQESDELLRKLRDEFSALLRSDGYIVTCGETTIFIYDGEIGRTALAEEVSLVFLG